MYKRQPYHYTFTACFIGKASHAGVAPEQGISAIEAACCAVEHMRQAGVLGAVGAYCASNIGRISGGSANNVVAPECEMTGECRAVEQADVERVRSAMDDAMREAAELILSLIHISRKPFTARSTMAPAS